MDRAPRVDESKDKPDTASASLRLLGVPCLHRADGSVHFLERLEAALLAHLLIEGPASRAAMAALLWPRVDTEHARANLRQRLRRLKSAAGFDLLAGSDPLLRVRADLAHDLGGDGPAFVDGAGDAGAELLEGLAFADVEGLHEWVMAARARVGAARRAALEHEATQLEAAGHVAAALRVAERLLEFDALDEAAHRRVMRLHHTRGDRAAALHAYQHCKDLLTRELGVAPGRETRALKAEIESGAQPPCGAAARPRPLVLTRPPRLIGRDRELAALNSGWQRSAVVAVLGEAGVGKSRLIAEFAAHHAPAVSTGARPGDTQVAFALLARLLRALPGLTGAELPPWVRLQFGHLLPELGRPDSPSLNPLRLRQALVWLLGNLPALHSGAIVIDDLQFADEATLEELPALLAADIEPPLRWLLAARSAEIPPLLRSVLEGGDPLRATVVLLEPLAVADVQALLDSLALDGLDAAAWAAPLHRHTGGNPMFILQTLLAMGDGSTGASPLSSVAALPLPGRVGELVDRRIAQLSAPARELAQVAALAGQDFDARLAMHVLERHAADLSDAWRELESAQVLRDEAFAHDLVFEATLRSVPPQAAGPWHARIAACLESATGSLPRIAAHWAAAEQWAPAGQAYLRAAEQINKLMRKFEEAALLDKAQACFAAAGDPAGEAEACLQLFHTHWFRKFRPGFRQAAERLQALRGTSLRARLYAAACAAQVANDVRPNEESLALMREAGRLAEGLGEFGIALWQLGNEAATNALLNRPRSAMAAARRGLVLIEKAKPDYLSISSLQNIGFTLELCGQVAHADRVLERAEQSFRNFDHAPGVADVQCFQSLCAYFSGRLDDAAELLAQGRRALAEINGGRAEVHTADSWQARYWRNQGRLSEALTLLEDRHARRAEHGDDNVHGGMCVELGVVYLTLGQPHRVYALIEPPRTAARLPVRLEGLLLEAALARAEGRSARTLLEEAVALAPSCQRPERYGWHGQLELSVDQEPDRAIDELRRIVKAARARGIWSHEAPARVRLIEALLRGGRVAQAHAQARALGLALTDKPPMTLYAGEYDWALARAFDAAGDTAARDALLGRALARIADLVRHHVPDAFRDSFLNRNPFNRQLRAMAARHGAGAV